MIGLVIVAHGGLAREFLAATEHVVGRLEGARAVPTGPEDDLDAKKAEIVAAIRAVERGDGVIVVTDMFGGTPCNLALGAMSASRIEVICGASLPMLVKLAKMRDRPLEEAARAAVAAGVKYVNCASDVMAPSGG